MNDRLSNFAGLTALVGTRIFASRLPQEVTLPAVSLFRITRSNADARVSGQDGPLTHGIVQVDSWALSYNAAKDVADQVRAALSRWSGTHLGLVVQQGFIENEQDFYEDDTKIFHIAQDYDVWYEEA